MASFPEVMRFLLPDGGYAAYGEKYEDIVFIEASPFTKEQFEAGFAQYDAWKAEQDAAQATKKAAAEAKLAALGLTADDLKALGLGGN